MFIAAISILVFLAGTVVFLRARGERMRAEQLREEYTLLKQVVTETTNTGVLELRVSTKECIWDKHSQDVFGLVEERMVTKEDVFFGGIHREDRESFWRHYAQLMAKEKTFQMELRVVQPEETIRYVELSGVVHGHKKGQVDRILFLVHDINAQKENEKLLGSKTAMLEGLGALQRQFLREPNPSSAFDSMLAVLLDTAASEYGFIGEVLRKEDNTPYLKTHAITNIAWNKDTREFFEKYAPVGLEFYNLHTLFGSVMTSEKPVIANNPANDSRAGGLPEGHPDMRSFLGVPFFQGTEMIGMVGVANRPGGFNEETITMLEPILATCSSMVYSHRLDKIRKSQEDELRASRDQAFAASKAKSDFLARMSHEMRTPLNGVIGMSSLLVETSLDDEQHEYVRTINTSAESLLTVINDVLEFSRLESDGLQFEMRAMNTISCLEETLDVMLFETGRKGIELVSYIAPDVPLSVLGDISRIRQVLLNLITNAVKFTHKGGIQVSLEAERVAYENDTEICRLIFTVKDTGIGIEKEKLNHIFESFMQADTSITRRYGGTGLGLAISKQIVEVMGGSIEVESELGEGALFRFSIMAPVLLNYLTVETRVSASLLQDRPVLLITEPGIACNVLRQQLESWEMKVSVCHERDQAISELQIKKSLDIVLVDSLLLGDGNWLTDALPDKQIPTIAIAEFHEHYQSKAPHQFTVHKPFKCLKLARVLKEALDTRKETVS